MTQTTIVTATGRQQSHLKRIVLMCHKPQTQLVAINERYMFMKESSNSVNFMKYTLSQR